MCGTSTWWLMCVCRMLSQPLLFALVTSILFLRASLLALGGSGVRCKSVQHRQVQRRRQWLWLWMTCILVLRSHSCSQASYWTVCTRASPGRCMGFSGKVSWEGNPKDIVEHCMVSVACFSDSYFSFTTPGHPNPTTHSPPPPRTHT
jgi:hypothetical protein